MLRPERFSSESSSTASIDSIDSGEAAGKLDFPTSSVILTRKIGALQELFSIYPKAELTFRGSIRAANLDKGIKGADFKSKKEQMLILHYLLENHEGLDTDQTRSLRDAICLGRDKQKALQLLKCFAKEEDNNRLLAKAKISKEEAMWRNALNYASSISDVRFLSHVKTILSPNVLHDAAVECEETAYDCLKIQLDSLASGISQQILSTQKEELDKQVQREVKSEEEKELKVSRAEFVLRVEDLSRERSKSWVAYSSY